MASECVSLRVVWCGERRDVAWEASELRDVV